MMREYHVRICERLGVKLPGPTRQHCGNAGTRFRQARSREASASEPLQKCRKRIRRCQNRGVTLPPGSARGNPEVCPSDIRHVGGAKLDQAFVRNVRTYTAMLRETAQAAPTARPTVPMRRLGADCSVVVTKRGNARGAKGAGHRRARGSTGSYREEPACSAEGGSLHAMARAG